MRRIGIYPTWNNSRPSLKLAVDAPEALAFFASVHVQDWACARKIKTGMETCDLFAFLTTEASEPVKSVRPKAMLVRLTEFGVSRPE